MLVRIMKDESSGNLYSYGESNSGNELRRIRETLVMYDSETRIVYWNYECPAGNLKIHSICGYMCPYIGKNGKFCRFIDNKIVEVD